MRQSVALLLLCSTQCLQHKLKPHITNLSYASQLNTVIERYSWLRQAWLTGPKKSFLDLFFNLSWAKYLQEYQKQLGQNISKTVGAIIEATYDEAITAGIKNYERTSEH